MFLCLLCNTGQDIVAWIASHMNVDNQGILFII